ncbi:helix-turn-helix domain-containing protein [Leucobacter sp. G161]|uniref:helix-turn-helix domain-containing protein n=1 Tax=Leucobacter sp. G161 TaxID=663704 RepID=UPI00073B0308|nr:helix-turn-helix domain-containing protein [Leucobacter sp. G161]KUF06775.1 hypothetical protein AUL38_10985 [Leucobacter sp. G161]
MTSPKPIGTLAEARESTLAAITRAEAGAIAGVDPRTITAGIKDGTIPAIKLGRRVLIPREKFIKLFEVEDD